MLVVSCLAVCWPFTYWASFVNSFVLAVWLLTAYPCLEFCDGVGIWVCLLLFLSFLFGFLTLFLSSFSFLFCPVLGPFWAFRFGSRLYSFGGHGQRWFGGGGKSLAGSSSIRLRRGRPLVTSSSLRLCSYLPPGLSLYFLYSPSHFVCMRVRMVILWFLHPHSLIFPLGLCFFLSPFSFFLRCPFFGSRYLQWLELRLPASICLHSRSCSRSRVLARYMIRPSLLLFPSICSSSSLRSDLGPRLCHLADHFRRPLDVRVPRVF